MIITSIAILGSTQLRGLDAYNYQTFHSNHKNLSMLIKEVN